LQLVPFWLDDDGMLTAQPSRRKPDEDARTEAGEFLFPVGTVARGLDVSPSTLRAWERRYGLGPTARTVGSHRRYSRDDVERLRRMRDLVRVGVAAAAAAAAVGAEQGEPAPGAGSRITAERLTGAMHRLDVDAIGALASAALHTLGAATAWVRVFAPALVAVGEQWETTGCGVEVEHLTSGILEAALRRHVHRMAAPPVREGAIALAAVPGEAHTLPLTALAAALAEKGCASVLVGDLPAKALRDAVTRLQPTAVVMWSRMRGSADPDWLQAVTAACDTPFHPAGPGWPADFDPGYLASLPSALGSLVPPNVPVPRALHDASDLWPV
jgi:DNA-binding transcriptional MerR regulator